MSAAPTAIPQTDAIKRAMSLHGPDRANALLAAGWDHKTRVRIDGTVEVESPSGRIHVHAVPEFGTWLGRCSCPAQTECWTFQYARKEIFFGAARYDSLLPTPALTQRRPVALDDDVVDSAPTRRGQIYRSEEW